MNIDGAATYAEAHSVLKLMYFTCASFISMQIRAVDRCSQQSYKIHKRFVFKEGKKEKAKKEIKHKIKSLCSTSIQTIRENLNKTNA